MALIPLLLATAALAEAPRKTVDFNRDIRPILSDNCYFCHGPDKNKRKADLRLDTRGGLFDEIDDVRPVVPGKPAESDLFARITTHDAEDHMPPAESNKALSPEQVATVKRWIEEGAEYKGHWAYIKPVKPEVPKRDDRAMGGLPARVSLDQADTGGQAAHGTNGWNPIDGFVDAKLKSATLRPNGEADKATLCRRVHFDLLGLPPTPEQVDEFVHDARPDAFETLVDRLLASPHFGERMAVPWLDQVRYADTIGYHSDNPQNVWPYRDWVIAAFNQNMPFDRFTVEQLAGDLLPDATNSQKVASAYNRLLQTTEEGGAQPKEYEAKYASDRVRNVSAVWMAQTMGCCECHDHKFDPLATKEFYGMEAFFADIQEAGVGKREPGMPLPSAEQQLGLAMLDRSLAAAKAEMNLATPALAAAQAEWEKTVAQEVAWEILDPETFTVQGESKLKKVEGESNRGILQTVYKVAANENFTITVHTAAKDITGFRLEALPDDALPSHGPGNAPNGNFVLSDVRIMRVGKDGKPVAVPLRNASADFSQDGFPIASVLDPKRKNRKTTGWAILPQVGKPHEAVFETAKPFGDESGTLLRFTLDFQSVHPQHTIGRLRLSCTTAPEPSRRAMPKPVRDALKVAVGKRSAEQKERVAAHYRTIAPLLQPMRDEVAGLEQKKQQQLDAMPKCLVTTAVLTPRKIHVLPRGNWLDESGRGDVTGGARGNLGRMSIEPAGRRPTRLDSGPVAGLARKSPCCPSFRQPALEARFSARASSKSSTISDRKASRAFTHPELLDWLACEFRGQRLGRQADWSS